MNRKAAPATRGRTTRLSGTDYDSSQSLPLELSKTTRRTQRFSKRRVVSAGEMNINTTGDTETISSMSNVPQGSVGSVSETSKKGSVSKKPAAAAKKAPGKKRIIDPRIAPRVDSPEKIVFCIDMSSDMNESPFNLGKGGLFSPLCMLKRTVEMFVLNKLRINNKHEFAVVGFHNTAIWVGNFTSELKKISTALDQLYEMNICEDSALPSVFKLISVVAADLPSFQKPEIVPPPFVFRVILIYGRSHCLPENENVEKVLGKLKGSPYFFLDILYIHEIPSSDNKCQEIFDRLCDFDEKGTSYIFEVGRNTTKLHNCMAKLLAHPLQRPLQKVSNYKLS